MNLKVKPNHIVRHSIGARVRGLHQSEGIIHLLLNWDDLQSLHDSIVSVVCWIHWSC